MKPATSPEELRLKEKMPRGIVGRQIDCAKRAQIGGGKWGQKERTIQTSRHEREREQRPALRKREELLFKPVYSTGDSTELGTAETMKLTEQARDSITYHRIVIKKTKGPSRAP